MLVMLTADLGFIPGIFYSHSLDICNILLHHGQFDLMPLISKSKISYKLLTDLRILPFHWNNLLHPAV